MSPLHPEPEPSVLPRASRSVAQLRRAADRNGHRFIEIRATTAVDQAGVMAVLASGLDLPEHFGANLDALYDCLTDLEVGPGGDSPGLVILIDDLPPPSLWSDAERTALLDTFEDAALYFGARGVRLRVYWSIRRPQPLRH